MFNYPVNYYLSVKNHFLMNNKCSTKQSTYLLLPLRYWINLQLKKSRVGIKFAFLIELANLSLSFLILNFSFFLTLRAWNTSKAEIKLSTSLKILNWAFCKAQQFIKLNFAHSILISPFLKSSIQTYKKLN